MKNITSRPRKGPFRNSDKERFWRKTLKEHADSGKEVRVFCRQRGLTEPSFYAWRRTIAQRDGSGKLPPVASKRPTFVELRAEPSGFLSTDVPLELVVGDRRLLIRSGCDRSLLRDVLAALTSSNPVETEA